MHFRQRLREVAVAFVGDDDRRAGLRDEEIRAGDAEVRRSGISGAESLARFREELHRLREIAIDRQMRVHATESASTCSFVRCTAGPMICEGISPRSCTIYSPRSVSTATMPAAFERIVQRDLLGDHRFALSDRLGAAGARR